MGSHNLSQPKAAMRVNLKLGCQLFDVKARKKPQPFSVCRWREVVSAAANRLDYKIGQKDIQRKRVCSTRGRWPQLKCKKKNRGVMYHKDASGLLTTNQHSNSKHSWSLDWTITWQQLVSLWEGILRINESTNSFLLTIYGNKKKPVIRASWFCNVVILVSRRYWKAYAVLPLMIIEFISRDSCPQGNPGWIQEEYFGVV